MALWVRVATGELRTRDRMIAIAALCRMATIAQCIEMTSASLHRLIVVFLISTLVSVQFISESNSEKIISFILLCICRSDYKIKVVYRISQVYCFRNLKFVFRFTRCHKYDALSYVQSDRQTDRQTWTDRQILRQMEVLVTLELLVLVT